LITKGERRRTLAHASCQRSIRRHSRSCNSQKSRNNGSSRSRSSAHISNREAIVERRTMGNEERERGGGVSRRKRQHHIKFNTDVILSLIWR
jgi:hypothetical protein